MRLSSLRLAALTALLTGLAPSVAAQGTCASGLADAVLDANDVSARLYNNGGLFWRGGEPQYEVPKGSGLQSIFAAGLWVGGVVDGELRTAAADYQDWEFWPGPLTDGAPPADCSVFDRIYVVSQADIEAYEQTGTATPDLAEWPADLGAAVEDGDGDPDNYDLAAGDRPELFGAAQTAWWVMNDAGNTHDNTGTAPIGLEVRVQAFSFLPDDFPFDFVGTSTFYQYTLVYQGAAPIEAMYVSLWVDGDLGNFEDDYVGSAAAVGLGYTYNADDDDEGIGGYGVDPPAVGVFGAVGTEGPTPRSPLDAFRQGGSRAPTSSVMVYENNQTVRGNPETAADHYNYQQARWKDGTRLIAGGDGYDPTSLRATPFVFPGRPPGYWSEYDALPAPGAQPNASGDRRFIQTFGPFGLDPGERATVTAGVLWARRAGGGAIGSRDELARQASALSGVEYAPEPIFGNALGPLAVTARQDEVTALEIRVANPGDAVLEFDFEAGTEPGAEAFIFQANSNFVAPGSVTDAVVSVEPPNTLPPGVYQTALVARSNDRNVVRGRIPVTLTVLEPLSGETVGSGVFALAAPRPNPAAGTTRLDFSTATAGPVRLSVVDVLGREVLLALDEARAAGTHHADLDVGALPPGLYVARLRADGREAVQRLTVVR